MFLNELKDNLKKMLFIELATLMLMAEGDDKVIPSFSELLEDDDVELDEINLSEINSLDFGALMAGYTLSHNIDESELEIFTQYAKELNLRFNKNYSVEWWVSDELFEVSVLLDKGCRCYSTDDEHINISSVAPDESEGLFTSLSYALGMASKQVMEESQENNDIKELVTSIISSNFNANPIHIKTEILKIPSIQQKILEATAETLIKTKLDYISSFSEREKKIMLFELIGSGFASGHFEDQEKSLLTKICVLMDIEKEYIDEFTDVTTRLFVVNKELAELINE